MKKLILLLTLVVGCGAHAGGAFPPPIFPATEKWPDVGAVVLEDVATLEYKILRTSGKSPRLVAVLDHRRRLKVVDEAGLRFAQVVLPVDAYSRISWVKARSALPNGATTSLDPGQPVLRSRPSLPKNDDAKEVAFTVPGVRVGGLIDYRYERVYEDVDMIPAWVFGDRPPVVRAELGIIVPEQLKIDYRYGQGDDVVTKHPLHRSAGGGKVRLVFVENDLPAYYDEPGMPDLGRVAPWVAVVVTKATVGTKQTRLETWEQVADRVMAMIDRVGGERGTGGAEERFRAAQASLRSLEVPGLGVRRPVPARELEKGEPACFRDAAAYLLRALEGSGARAFPALLASPKGPKEIEGFASLHAFVAVVVAVDVTREKEKDPSCKGDPMGHSPICSVPAGDFAFLDPLCKQCRYGELPIELTGGRALVLHDDGPLWVDVPPDPPERNVLATNFNLSLDVDGTVSGRVTGETQGTTRRRLHQDLERVERGTARDAVLTRQLFGEGGPVVVSGARFANPTSVDDPLSVRGKVEVALQKLEYERYSLRPVDIAGRTFVGHQRASRRWPAILDAPATSVAVATLLLPVGYEIALPEAAKLVESFAEYSASFERRDRELLFTRRLILKKHVIPANQWPDFRSFIEQVETYEAQNLEVRAAADDGH